MYNTSLRVTYVNNDSPYISLVREQFKNDHLEGCKVDARPVNIATHDPSIINSLINGKLLTDAEKRQILNLNPKKEEA